MKQFFYLPMVCFLGLSIFILLKPNHRTAIKSDDLSLLGVTGVESSLKTKPIDSLLSDSLKSARSSRVSEHKLLGLRNRTAYKDTNRNELFPEKYFHGSGLTKKEIEPWLVKGKMGGVYYQDQSRNLVIKPTEIGDVPNEGILFISSTDALIEVAKKRQLSFSKVGTFKASEKKTQQLLSSDYELYRFNAGLRDDRVTSITQDKNIYKAVMGPDFSSEGIDPEDADALKKLRDSVLSLGHGGEVTIQVKDGGSVIDGPGPDFVIYENVFKINEGSRNYYQEFAYVGVADQDVESSYRWFSCDPIKFEVIGCAGVMPTAEGGDQFDIGHLGLKKIRYIKIKDFGKNYNLGKNTEGFDLDAVKLIHAVREID